MNQMMPLRLIFRLCAQDFFFTALIIFMSLISSEVLMAFRAIDPDAEIWGWEPSAISAIIQTL